MGFGCPFSKQFRTGVRTDGGYGHTVELRTATSSRGAPSASERNPETVIPTLQHGETEAQHQLTNPPWAFQRQTITTTVPAPAPPPPAPKSLLRSRIAAIMPRMEPDSPLD